ncbi:hypothetical protein L7F22_037339 [Adiantum nelumboides]|nr:hypothetical protein [Adiantum nelumboides]
MAGGTRQKRHEVLSKNQPSPEQEISATEEGEEKKSAQSSHGATVMTSSDASDESYKFPSHMVDPDSSSQSDSGPSGRPQVNPKIIRKQAQQLLHHSINRPAKSKSQTAFTLKFYLQLPRPSMTDMFSQEQLQKLGLTALATAELPTDVPGDMVHELLNRFPKVWGHNLTPERIGHALGMTTFPSVKPTTRTYSKISKDATIQACQDLLHSDHPNYARNMELWNVFKYYFLLRDARENTKSLSTIFSHCEGLYCLIHTMPCGFHQILYTSLQSRAKRFRAQVQFVQSSFQCLAAPMLAWVINIHISPMDVDADTSTPQSIARGKGKSKDASTKSTQTTGVANEAVPTRAPQVFACPQAPNPTYVDQETDSPPTLFLDKCDESFSLDTAQSVDLKKPIKAEKAWNGGVLHLVLTVLKLHVPFLLAESKYLVSLVARLKSKALSLMIKFCETESVSFLDEVAADVRTMHLAEMVAAEVFTLVRKALIEEPRESQESEDEEDEMLSGLLYIHAMRMADIFSDDSNFRNSVMDFIAPDLAKVLAQSPTTFLTRWCGRLTTEQIKSGSDSVLIYDPFRAAGAAMHSFKSSGGSSTRASGSNNALLPDDSSGCSLSAGQLQFASYSQERSSLFVKILANLHCFNPEICPANEKDRFLNLFIECLMVGPFTPGNSAFFLSTVQTAVRVCENLFLLLDHVSSLSSEVVSDEDLQLVSTFYCALHEAICPSAVFESALQEDPVVAYVRDAHEQKRKALLGQWQRSERWKRIQSFDPSDDKEQSNAGSSINKSTSNTSLSQAVDEQATSEFVEVMHMDRADVVLGREWLHSLGLSLKRSYVHNMASFDVDGIHVLLLGEKNVPPSPLICAACVDHNGNDLKGSSPALHNSLFSHFKLPQDATSNVILENEQSVQQLLYNTLNVKNINTPSSFVVVRAQVRLRLQELLQEYKDVFPEDLLVGLPLERAIDHGIDTMSGTKPISKPSYRLSHKEAIEVEKQLTDYISRGFIKLSSSP